MCKMGGEAEVFLEDKEGSHIFLIVEFWLELAGFLLDILMSFDGGLILTMMDFGDARVLTMG